MICRKFSASSGWAAETRKELPWRSPLRQLRRYGAPKTRGQRKPPWSGYNRPVKRTWRADCALESRTDVAREIAIGLGSELLADTLGMENENALMGC